MEQSGGTGEVQPRREQSRMGEGSGGEMAVGGCRKMTNTARLGVLISVEAQGEGEGDAGQEGGGEATARAMRWTSIWRASSCKVSRRTSEMSSWQPWHQWGGQGLEGWGCGGIPWHRSGSAPGPEGGAGVRGGTHLRNEGSQSAKRPILEKRERKDVSQCWLNHGKSECGFPRGTGHQHQGERDNLGKNPSGSFCHKYHAVLTFKEQNTVTDVVETAVVDHGSHHVDISIKGASPRNGSTEEGQTQIVERSWKPENWRRGDNGWWSKVLTKGACNQRRRKVTSPGSRGSWKRQRGKKGPRSTGRRNNSEWGGVKNPTDEIGWLSLRARLQSWTWCWGGWQPPVRWSPSILPSHDCKRTAAGGERSNEWKWSCMHWSEWVVQNWDCLERTCSRLAVEWGGTPRRDPQEQVFVKLDGKRAKIECQNREEWGQDACGTGGWNEGQRFDKKHRNTTEPVKDDVRRRRTQSTRDCGKSRDVLHGSGRTAWTKHTLEGPKEARGLGQTGEQETIPCGRHPRISQSWDPQLWAQQRDGKKDVACHQGHKENWVKNWKGTLWKRTRWECWGTRRWLQEGGSDRTETRFCVQKGQWSPQFMILSSQTFVMNTWTTARKRKERSVRLKRGTNHVLVCRTPHVTNTITAQVLEV